ncbi:MAG: hypothetical protein XE07_0590 [Methanothrix harundinacea]|uniref:Uncharacterized protein n=1 Tax=Methanothrix harundinacea TaxID=301375 RepID=A0A101IKR2_9EURY|nr:MAG: hypothetical protein XE07_0590 [Methanothrix harundinacea]
MVEEMLDIVRSISREFEVGTTRHEKVLGRHVGFLPAGRSEIAQLVEKFSENDLEGVLNQMVKDGVAKFEGYDVIIRDPAGRPKKESDR